MPRLAKDMTAPPILGPPRNAELWLRAKGMAAMWGKPYDFQTILQAYQMLTLAPGFAAVSKSLGYLVAGQRLNASPEMDRVVQSMLIHGPDAAAPARQVAGLGEVVAGLPLAPPDAAQLGSDLAQALDAADTPADAMRASLEACSQHPDLDGPMAQEVAKRVGYIHTYTIKGHSMDLTIKKASGGPGSRGGKVIGTTRSGKSIYAHADHPGHQSFTAKDHVDAARMHSNLSSASGLDAARSNLRPGRAATIESSGYGLKAAGHNLEGQKHRRLAYSLKSPAGMRKATGGPGSRGGKVIGTTRSGKPIYEASHAEYKDHRPGDVKFSGYSKEDHADAHALHKEAGAKIYAQADAIQHAYATRHNNTSVREDSAQHAAGQAQFRSGTAARAQAQAHVEAAATHALAMSASKSLRLGLASLRKAGGPGSRGGKVIGTTRSGKPIYASGNTGARGKGFTEEDHAHAAAHHELQAKAHWVTGEDLLSSSDKSLHAAGQAHMDQGGKHWDHAKMHGSKVSEPVRERVRSHLGPREIPMVAPMMGKSINSQSNPKERKPSMLDHACRYAMIADISKAQGGPGSRGGKVIGTTRSGKPIYEGGRHAPHHEGFTSDDHKDAARINDAKADAISSRTGAQAPRTRQNQSARNKQVYFRDAAGHHNEMAHKLGGVAPAMGKSINSQTQTDPKDPPMPDHADRYRMIQDISKAQGGPGSRGGKVIGTTRSGKPIYDSHDHSGHQKFSPADHKDAAAAHFTAADKIYGRAKKLGESKQGQTASGMKRYDAMSDKASAHSRQGMVHHYASNRPSASSKPFLSQAVRATVKKSQGGPGSRGGKVIGTTRSGKPIYSSSGGQSFSKKEHGEASAAHRTIARVALGNVKAWKKDAGPGAERAAKVKQYSQLAQHHGRMADMHEAKKGLDVTPSFSKAQGGPGSRGGRVIGTTRSGKPIYAEANHPAHSDFTHGEHVAATKIHHAAMNAAIAERQAAFEKVRGTHSDYSDSGMAGIPGYKQADAKVQHHYVQQTRHMDAASFVKKSMHSVSRKSFLNQDTGDYSMKKSDDMTGITLTPGGIPASSGASQQAVDGLSDLQQMIADFEMANVGGTQGATLIDMATRDVTETGVDGATFTSQQVDATGNAPRLPIGQTIEIQKAQASHHAPAPFDPHDRCHPVLHLGSPRRPPGATS